MPLESFAQPEVAVAAAATAAVASPSIRRVFRQSLVYGLAGVLVAYDRSSAAARSVVSGVRQGMNSAKPTTDAVPDAAPPPPPAGQAGGVS
jgi:hypothetical protein